VFHVQYLGNVNTCHQAPSSPVSAERLDGGVLSSLEALVEAEFAGRTDSWVTLVEHKTVDAVRVRTTRCLGILLAVATGQLAYHHPRNVHIADRHVTLH